MGGTADSMVTDVVEVGASVERMVADFPFVALIGGVYEGSVTVLAGFSLFLVCCAMRGTGQHNIKRKRKVFID